jgi:4'-phosphopantetheinyl transferase EntD
MVAKKLALETLGEVRLADLEIESRDSAGRSIRPRACWSGRPLSWVISIAHSDRAVLAAVAPPSVAVGVDLTPAEQRFERGFAECWFTAEERAGFDGDNDSTVLLAWAIKEATYKAINCGERFEPRRFHVERRTGGAWTCRPMDGYGDGHCRTTTWSTSCGEFAVLAIRTTTNDIHEAELTHD